MNSYERIHVKTLIDRLNEPVSRIIALFGPRQTGKTTIVQQALRRIDCPSRYVAVDDPMPVSLYDSREEVGAQTFQIPGSPKDAEWLIRQWEYARVEARKDERGCVLVFDEIQKIPRWSEVVKGLWDADRSEDFSIQVVILGSAPLLMQAGLNESLAGRFETIFVTHWSFDEMVKAFDFDLSTYLYFGGYPGSEPLVRDLDRWRNYILRSLVNPNIERDILSMQRVDKPALLRQLFELGAAYSGQILAYNKMLGQLQDAGNTTTLARYLELLSEAGLITGLQNYARRSHRRRASIPKLLVLNTALMTVDSGYSFDEANADRTFRGRIVESAVGAHLFNTTSTDIRLYYWREDSYEVDYVLQRGRSIIAIEVKSGTKMRLTGMERFIERFRPYKSMVVGEGGVPLNEFLTVPAHYWFD
ncbi:MAG: ATP-binding protein [Gemmatimonadota bacterium]|nr:ATP-binding protein [Gemmatimonadota bacterium]